MILIYRVKEALKKALSEKESLLKKLSKEAGSRTKTEENLARANINLRNCEVEIAGLTRQVELEKKATEKVTREKDSAIKAEGELEELNKQMTVDIRMLQQTYRKAEATIEEMTETLNELRRQVSSLEKERDRSNLECRDLLDKV